jgi:regulator of protease activity HflC (stomatin/prohibitin superfamily)
MMRRKRNQLGSEWPADATGHGGAPYDVLLDAPFEDDPQMFEPPARDGHDPSHAGKRGDPPRWALALLRHRALRRLGTLVLAVVALALAVGVSGVRVTHGDVGSVAVVRNGGPLDNRHFRQVIMPGQKLTYTGLFSQSPHEYPAAHVTLRYTVTGAPPPRPTPASETVMLPTKDGVLVGLDATVFLRFVGDRDLDTLTKFDFSVGTRQFPTPTGGRLYPWQSADGFNSMLDALFRPVLDNDLRKEIGRFPCAELVSSCSLIGGASMGSSAKINEHIAQVEASLNGSLEDDLKLALGQPYFWDIRVRIGEVTLPRGVQNAINNAQAELAGVNSARADLKQARFRARANRLLGRTYNKSPGLATIETMKAIPPGSTVIVSPGGHAPTVLAGGNSGGAGRPGTGSGASDGDATDGTDGTDQGAAGDSQGAQ